MKKLNPGEHSDVNVTAYKVDDAGKLVRVTSARAATRWRARCYFRTEDGTRKDVTRWGDTRREVEASMKEALDDMKRATKQAGTLTPSSPLVDAGKAWLERIQRSDSKLSPRSVTEYTSTWSRYIDTEGSTFRPLTVKQANDPQRLRPFLEKIADEHGTGAAQHCKTVLSNVFGHCVSLGVLDSNGTRGVGKVKSQKPKETVRNTRRAFTEEERSNVLAAAQARVEQAKNPRSARKWQRASDVAAFMMGTGVRINEARTLKWADVDLATGRVHIAGTKTLSADRWLNLPGWLTERLTTRADTFGQEGYVFAVDTVPNNGKPAEQVNLQEDLRLILNDAGCEWATPHSFRRTVATTLHQNGAALSRIADQLGHKDAAMTMSAYLGRDPHGDKADLADML